MSKRYSESTVWGDPWYRSLSTIQKLLWKFLLDNCDYAGIWKTDLGLASFLIGENVSEEMIESLNSHEKTRVKKYEGGKYFVICDYVSFQYGPLNNSKFHHAICRKLLKFGIIADTLSDTLSDRVCHTPLNTNTNTNTNKEKYGSEYKSSYSSGGFGGAKAKPGKYSPK